jgi:hypothetical protein
VAKDAETCPYCRRLLPRHSLTIGWGPIGDLCVNPWVYSTALESMRNGPFNLTAYVRNQDRASGENVDEPIDQHKADRLAGGCLGIVAFLPREGLVRDFDHGEVGLSFSQLSFVQQEYAAGIFRGDQPHVNAFTLIDKATGSTIGKSDRGALILAKRKTLSAVTPAFPPERIR